MRITSRIVLGVVALAIATSVAVGVGDVWGTQHVGSPVGPFVFGLLGLAAREDPGSAIDRLTEKVERIAAGKYDVDIATDQGDDLGRLYEAVEDLAATLRDRECESRRNERRFEAVFDDPHMLAGLLEPDGTHLKSNETAMAYVDADEEDVAGAPFWETPWYTGPEEAQATIREKIKRAATGDSVGYECTLTDSDGEQCATGW